MSCARTSPTTGFQRVQMHTALKSAAKCTSLYRAYVHGCSSVATRIQQQHCLYTCPAATAAASTATAVYLAPGEEHLQHLATLLAQHRCAGDCYCLYGSVGAGKSVYSRAFITAAAEDPTLPVPSPTYLLQLIYDEQEGPPIHHFDLYRLCPQQDMSRLDLAASLRSAVSLVEWAERLPQQLLPQQRLEVHISILEEDAGAESSSSSSSISSGSGSSSDCDVQQGPGQPQEQQHHQQQQLDWHRQLQQRQQQQVQVLQQQQHQEVLLLPTPELQLLQQQSMVEIAQSVQDTGEEEFEEAADEYEDLFSDKRWRLVQLRAVGESWAARVRQLAYDMQQQQQQQQQ
ncbi:hypothetical protein COO60DRAFT_908809 [Scenedesmus sp. NREL 46B-D3]|nr:hypothetical protein COO60DRAFT_908809 [Scenedesmus sp. NREL 46B-D3]